MQQQGKNETFWQNQVFAGMQMKLEIQLPWVWVEL